MLLVDLKQDKSKENKYFSNTLLNSIEKSLKEGKKIILYLNKRWDYSSLICNSCSNLYKCKNCDSSMSVHSDFLVCHICTFTKRIEKKCEKCSEENLQKIWIWTAQIENFLKEKYKNTKIFRFDTDVVKNKKEKEDALEKIKTANIIVWTKMITTWFDIKWVWLIWIILLEQELQIPKYDTAEKVYSNLKQFIWRWWRKWEKTDFIIQSFIPENTLLKNIVYSNYKDYFKIILEERKVFNYPPFSDFTIVEYRNKDKEKTLEYILKIKEKFDKINIDWKIEIINSNKAFKRQWQFYWRIILKWKNIREFLSNFKKEIFSDSNLSILFD